METNGLAISMQGVKKQYTLGVIGGTTLQRELQSWWAKKRGREDPNMRIGTDTRLYGQKFWALRGIGPHDPAGRAGRDHRRERRRQIDTAQDPRQGHGPHGGGDRHLGARLLAA